jgi:7,8-dihydropterin-6-yl-methyl-4-(beta-D-ribofuranosyl)aminobenzene 5'-phosphate synthase
LKLRILVDNYTFIDEYYLGEPGLSFYIEEAGKNYLLDTGYSDVLLKNAAAMRIDLKQLDTIILSHGHNDHTGGLRYLKMLYADMIKKPQLLAHPQAFWQRREGNLDIGIPVSMTELQQSFQVKQSTKPVWLSPRLIYLGEIKRYNGFEGKIFIGKIKNPAGNWIEDYVIDDSALIYCSNHGLVIMTGCSHAGICNITEMARQVCGESRIAAVIGGFHLLKTGKYQLQQTINHLHKQFPKAIYACHCTDLAAKMKLAETLPIHETGVGLSLEWDAV